MAILDGYPVEPSGLGIPPYLSTYVRDAYSALRKAYPSADVRCVTIDLSQTMITGSWGSSTAKSCGSEVTT